MIDSQRGGNTTVDSVALRGVASAVPMTEVDQAYYDAEFGYEEVRKIQTSIGINSRRSDPRVCASDLCFEASLRLIDSLNWDRNSVDGLILVTQTPDYAFPASSFLVHSRLGLRKECVVFDMNLGCSGFTYGLMVGARLLNGRSVKRLLVLAGDTLFRAASPVERSVALLFGDAGSAIALEWDQSAAPISFAWGSDGAGAGCIQRAIGGYRFGDTNSAANTDGKKSLFMDGPEVFSFTIREVPRMLSSVLQEAKWKHEDVDWWVLHQANRYMLEYLARRVNIPLNKMPISLSEYGNTSVASIPLTLNHSLRSDLSRERRRVVLGGFGVGLSWCAAACEMGNLVMPDIIEVRPGMQ